MKRLLIICAVAVAAVSCLKGSGFNTSLTSVVTFEYADNEFNSDSLLFDTKYSKAGFAWDMLEFYHKVDASSLEFKGGFLVSWLNTPFSGETEGLKNNCYRSNVKGLTNPKNKYAVLSITSDMPQKQFAFNCKSRGFEGTCTMKNVFVSNTVEVADSIKSQFVPGDQLILTATGYRADQMTDKAEIKLAEYTTAKDSIITTWTNFDLSKLGDIDSVEFDIVVPEGKDIPKAVCMDVLMAGLSLYLE